MGIYRFLCRYQVLITMVPRDRDKRLQLYPVRHDGRLRQGSCLILKPLVSRLRFASQVIQIRSQYLYPGNYRSFKVIQGNTITLPECVRVNEQYELKTFALVDPLVVLLWPSYIPL